MKYIDKFLKFLKTDRNTFLTYILTLFSIYILVDRVVELSFMFLSGISVSYWGPIKYTLALACPVFAFLFSGSSKFADSMKTKLYLFYTYFVVLYTVGISMAVQWLNALEWLLLLSVPNYVEIVTQFPELIGPAFKSLALYLPLVTFYPFFKFLFFTVNDTLDIQKSINDYQGIDLSDKSKGWGPYTCEISICYDKVNGKTIKIPEIRRYESMLVIGASGTGKTSMVFEPMVARDIEKKFFFKEVSKEMGFTALKTGIANLNCPYDNTYLNENFSLNMIKPTEGKEKLYKAYMSKMIYGNNSNGPIYKDLGITSISPDYESISHMIETAKNYHMNYHLIDPANPTSLGLNPFIYDDPTQTAIAISSVLKGMYSSTHSDEDLQFKENAAHQAIENLSILLKEMYPRLNNGLLPSLEDMLEMLNDFDLVEDMCNKLEANEELAREYKFQLGYFKKHFYRTGSVRQDTEKYIAATAAQIDNLLRVSGVRKILCNRTNNINYDKALENGEIIFVCTRRGDLGATANKAFGLFFLLIMQYSVLRRPGNEKTRIPHFLYIDEFSDFICNSTESIFTLYRKYKVGTIISAQNLSQLGKGNFIKSRETILANCSTKLAFGNNTPEDNDWWEREFGDHREWTFGNDYKTDKGEYDPNYKGIKWSWKRNIKSGEIQALKFKNCVLKTKDLKGKNIFAKGKVDFLESKYKEEHSPKNYNFSKFTNGITEDAKINKKDKFNLKNINFDTENSYDPIQTDTTDSKYLFNNEDAIIFDFKKDNQD